MAGTAGQYNITVNQGATYSQTFTWKADGSPVDITGYSARMQVRLGPNEDAILDMTDDDAITLGDAAGTIIVALTAAETAALSAGRYKYDLEMVAGDGGSVTRLLEGTFTVDAEITK